MAVTKADVLFIGRAGLNDNTQSAVIFTANSVVTYWLNTTTYSQYQVVEYSGSVYRSKIPANSNNQPSTSPNAFEVLYRGVKDGDFAFIIGTGATILQRQGGVWLVFGNHPGEAVYYDEQIDYVASSPGPHQAIGPLVPSTMITLPLNSRDSFSAESYIVGSGDLELMLNGDRLQPVDDWSEVGTSGNPSTTIQINIDIVVGDRLTFRKFTLVNVTAYGGSGGGGGGTLQDAYDNGAGINIITGNPFTVNGTGIGKCAQFNGDIGVTGIIDPAGITFSRQSSDPLGADDGLWVNNIGELMHKRIGSGTTNITQVIDNITQPTGVAVPMLNDSGLTIPALKPVSLTATGGIKQTDPTSENDADTFQGITLASINDGAVGNILVQGSVQNISTSIPVGSPVYADLLGDLTDIKPSIGVNGFSAGDWVIKVGTIMKNTSNPTFKDIIVNQTLRGQL